MLASATATAMPDPNGICDLPHCSRQRRILNPLSEARDGTTSSWILVRFITTEPRWELLISLSLSAFLCLPHRPSLALVLSTRKCGEAARARRALGK